jgi:hypothetical protein
MVGWAVGCSVGPGSADETIAAAIIRDGNRLFALPSSATGSIAEPEFSADPEVAASDHSEE